MMLLLRLVIVTLLAAGPAAQAAPRTGLLLVNADDGKVLMAENIDEAFMTASTMKLVTALAALDRFGPDHRFETSLSTTGQLADGVLAGDLVLRGQGDVELDLNDLMAMVLAMRGRGIKSVAGRFLVADQAFLRTDTINPSQPLDAAYNAGIGPLSLAFGRVDMWPDGDGTYYANPPLIERGPAWRIGMGLAPTTARPIPVMDVGMHAGQSLRRIARETGIDLPEPVRGSPQAQPRKLLTVMSKPLGDMVAGMLIYSNNQLAESIGLATATALKLKPASLAESAAGLWTDLSARMGDVDWRGFRITNHSGLDPHARATPRQLAALLAYGLERHALPHLMPANAWSGSLGKRLVEPGRLQRVWAKTGSLDFATALAGYLLPEGGGLWIFVLMTDDPERRAAYDGMPQPTADIRREAQQWEDEVKAIHDGFLRRWIDQRVLP